MRRAALPMIFVVWRFADTASNAEFLADLPSWDGSCAAPNISHAKSPSCDSGATVKDQDLCSVQCDENHYVICPSYAMPSCIVKCQNGAWDMSVHCAPIGKPCKSPSVSHASSPSCDKGSVINDSDSCEVRCDENFYAYYHPGGSRSRLTCRNGVWDASVECVASGSCHIHAPDHGSLGNCSRFLSPGQACLPACDAGYEVRGATSCNRGVLSLATCLTRPCRMEAPLHGSFGNCSATLDSGDACAPSCGSGYDLIGLTTCDGGKLQLATCYQRRCLVTAPGNGSMGDCGKHLASGESCVPRCLNGYTLQGVTSCGNGQLTLANCSSPDVASDRDPFLPSARYLIAIVSTAVVLGWAACQFANRPGLSHVQGRCIGMIIITFALLLAIAAWLWRWNVLQIAEDILELGFILLLFIIVIFAIRLFANQICSLWKVLRFHGWAVVKLVGIALLLSALSVCCFVFVTILLPLVAEFPALGRYLVKYWKIVLPSFCALLPHLLWATINSCSILLSPFNWLAKVSLSIMDFYEHCLRPMKYLGSSYSVLAPQRAVRDLVFHMGEYGLSKDLLEDQNVASSTIGEWAVRLSDIVVADKQFHFDASVYDVLIKELEEMEDVCLSDLLSFPFAYVKCAWPVVKKNFWRQLQLQATKQQYKRYLKANEEEGLPHAGMVMDQFNWYIGHSLALADVFAVLVERESWTVGIVSLWQELDSALSFLPPFLFPQLSKPTPSQRKQELLQRQLIVESLCKPTYETRQRHLSQSSVGSVESTPRWSTVGYLGVHDA